MSTINTYYANSRVSVYRDFVTSQLPYGTFWVTGSTSVVITAGEGIGVTTQNSIISSLESGGFPNQRITSNCKWIAPSTPADHEIGVMLRFFGIQSVNDTYYYARIDNGVLAIVRVLDSVFTTIGGPIPYALPANEVVTLQFICLHDPVNGLDQLTVNATAATPGFATITTTDNQLYPIGWGCMGMRTQSSTGYFRDVLEEQI